MPLFRKAARQDPLIVAMTGATLGSRVLILAGADAELAADLGAKAGLSGLTVALAATTAGARHITGRAERQGVLVEAGVLALPLSFEGAAFDLVVADDRPSADGARTTAALLAESFRVLRPGGRIVILRAAPRRWRLPVNPPAPAVDPALDERLRHAGFRARRIVATREGISFVEAAKAA